MLWRGKKAKGENQTLSEIRSEFEISREVHKQNANLLTFLYYKKAINGDIYVCMYYIHGQCGKEDKQAGTYILQPE